MVASIKYMLLFMLIYHGAHFFFLENIYCWNIVLSMIFVFANRISYEKSDDKYDFRMTNLTHENHTAISMIFVWPIWHTKIILNFCGVFDTLWTFWKNLTVWFSFKPWNLSFFSFVKLSSLFDSFILMKIQQIQNQKYKMVYGYI